MKLVNSIGERLTKHTAISRIYSDDFAGVAQWQSTSFPSWLRGFDSHHPLQVSLAASPHRQQSRQKTGGAGIAPGKAYFVGGDTHGKAKI